MLNEYEAYELASVNQIYVSSVQFRTQTYFPFMVGELSKANHHVRLSQFIIAPFELFPVSTYLSMKLEAEWI